MTNISCAMDIMGLEERIWQIREDLPGDVLLSAKLVQAAFKKEWNEVEKLLAAGADPRICRRGDAYGVESALYFALTDSKYDIAVKLYDAGDRLDDLISECENPLPWQVLDFLAQEMRWNRNYFFDESKPLSECCRCSAFARIEQLMPTASQQELDKSIPLAVRSWVRYFRKTDLYCKLLRELFAHGAKISPATKTELLEMIEHRFGKCPRALHPGQDALNRMIDLINNA